MIVYYLMRDRTPLTAAVTAGTLAVAGLILYAMLRTATFPSQGAR